jgi:hypothetical protein
VADQENPVSRRQFFRGLGGDLLRTIGELTGLDAEPEAPPVRNWDEASGEPIVDPQLQAAKLSEIFGFLEQLGAENREDQADLPDEPDPPLRLS